MNPYNGIESDEKVIGFCFGLLENPYNGIESRIPIPAKLFRTSRIHTMELKDTLDPNGPIRYPPESIQWN